MTFRPLSSYGGMQTDVAFDEGKMIIRHHQDAEAIVENNKRWQTDAGPQDKAFHRIASIPTTVIYRWLVEDGILPGMWMRMNRHDKAKFYRKKLNDPDYRYLKTTGARL